MFSPMVSLAKSFNFSWVWLPYIPAWLRHKNPILPSFLDNSSGINI